MFDDGADLPVVLQQDALQSFDSFPYVLIGWFDGIYCSMNALCSLFPHQSETHAPLLQPWHHMGLKQVHFWEHSSMGEIAPVEGHEFLDVHV